MKVCAGYGATDWLRALPTKDTTFIDPQYLVAFSLTFGLPIKAIGPSTTCVRTCALASEPVADFAAWRFGDHFFHCSAGSKLDGVTNCLGRHNNVSAILFALLREEFGYTCCSTQRGQALSLTDKKRVDFSAESIPRHVLPRAVDVTVLHPLCPAHLDDALTIGANFLALAGDAHKIKKHGADARAAGFELIPAVFASLGAWGPGIKKWFTELWQEKISRCIPKCHERMRFAPRGILQNGEEVGDGAELLVDVEAVCTFRHEDAAQHGVIGDVAGDRDLEVDVLDSRWDLVP